MDFRALAGFALALAGIAQPGAAQTLYVDVNGTPPGSGTQADPYTSIQTAIDASASGWTIVVAPGTYVGDLAVTESVHILSTAGPLATIIESDGSGPHAVDFSNGGGRLTGFTVRGVTSPSKAAVMVQPSDTVWVTRCVIAGNAGAGIRIRYDVFVQSCTITANGGAGIDNATSFNFILMHDSIVQGNGLQSDFEATSVLDVSYCLLQGEEATSSFGGNSNEPARLWSSAGSDFFPEPGSPAIDAGNPALLDPDGSILDIGALPFDPTHAPAAPETYCTSKLNSQGCSPVVGSSGTPSASGGTFAIDCSLVLNNKTGLFFYGFAGKASPYQGGYLCVAAPVKRTAIQGSGGNPPPDDCSGAYSFDFGALLQSGADPSLIPGQGVFGQFWYRDPALGGPFTTGRSEALGFLIAP
jgi:hypothetical protein